MSSISQASFITRLGWGLFRSSSYEFLDGSCTNCVHLCPLVSTCVHLLPLVTTCVRLSQLESTCVYLCPPVSSSFCLCPLCPLVSTCVHLRPPGLQKTSWEENVSWNRYIFQYNNKEYSPGVHLYQVVPSCVNFLLSVSP
jgi:hypothetical protein